MRDFAKGKIKLFLVHKTQFKIHAKNYVFNHAKIMINYNEFHNRKIRKIKLPSMYTVFKIGNY